MVDTKLLSEVLSDQGWYCIVGLKKNSVPRQIFVETLQEAEHEIQTLLGKEYDTYFACAKYATKSSRTKDNAKYFKAFWLDIDCGEAKTYPSQVEGVAALKEFCVNTGLPLPSVVNSGRGLHAYWTLEADITREQWKPAAEALKRLCVDHELFADPAVTADEARILRVPGTLNFKTDPPNDVEVLCHNKQISFETFANRLNIIKGEPPPQKQGLNELTLALMGNQEHRFRTIMLKTAEGKGCKQLENIAVNQESIEEPLWRAGLSIAAFCSDKHAAIHKISSQHPNYDREKTIKKTEEIKGPYTCEKFEGLNPGGCNECPHKGSIRSPIVLGREFLVASDEDNVVEVAQPLEETPVLVQIPPYPSPYFRGKKGGVYCAFDGDEPFLVYEHDLYVVKRMKDPQKGAIALLRLHLPRDGVREFTIPMTESTSKEKISALLSFQGVVAMPKQMEKILAYIITFIKELTFKTEIEIMRTQFGWADNHRKFVLGDKEIGAEGTRYSPPSSLTSPLSPAFEPVGSLEEWKNTINTYNMPGFEPHAFGFFTAFGSPLLKFLNLNGAVINLISSGSGTGKTTVLKAMNSVYGHPEELMLIWKDTMNTKMHRLGIMNNLPVGCDEITKMTADEISDFFYSISQGRGRGRMKSQENAERINLTRWALICVCTSNASSVDKLKSLKATPDGELMRVIEYQVDQTDNLTKEQADNIFKNLHDHYGHAGYTYIKWLVGNLEEALEIVRTTQAKLDTMMRLSNRERFWSAIVACNIGGAYIAKKLGLHDIDISRISNWAVHMIKQLRQETTPPVESRVSHIGEFINESLNSMVIVNAELDKRTNVEALPIMEPRSGKLSVRIEPDTRKLYISSKPFRDYCSQNQISIKELLNSLTVDGIYIGTERKRMSKGTKVSSPAVDAFVFDCSVANFIDPEDYVEAAKDDENSRNKL